MSQWSSAPNGAGRKRSPSASRPTWGPLPTPAAPPAPARGALARGSSLSASSHASAGSDACSPAAPAPPPPSRPSPTPGPTTTVVRPRRQPHLRPLGPLRCLGRRRRQFARGAGSASALSALSGASATSDACSPAALARPPPVPTRPESVRSNTGTRRDRLALGEPAPTPLPGAVCPRRVCVSVVGGARAAAKPSFGAVC